MKIFLLALAAALALGGCASAESQRSYTPKVQVLVRAPKARTAQANYQVSPEESAQNGSGGSAR